MAYLRRFEWFEIVGGILLASVALALFVWFPFGGGGSRVAEAIERCETNAATKQQCFGELVVEEANGEGIPQAFDTLATLYERDREFANYCHGNTHELGEIAYKLWKDGKDFGLSTKTSYCGFGFFHGFLEALLLETGDLVEARAFCDDLDGKLSETVSGVAVACYHGIGHGVIDGTDPTKWGNDELFIGDGLSLCERLSDEEEHKKLCASGVFNALAVAYRDPKFKLSISRADPFKICRTMNKSYNREMCYDQMNSYLIETSSGFGESLALAAASAEPDYKETAVRGVASYRAQSALAEPGNLADVIRECNALSTDALRDTCAQGFAAGLIEFGKPGEEYVAPVAACAATGERAEACFRGITFAVKDRLTSDLQMKLCEAIRETGAAASADACLDTMRGPQPKL